MSESPVRAAASGLSHARRMLSEGARQATWALTDEQVVARVADAVSLRAQADAILLAAIGEVDSRGLARARGATSTVAWLQGAHRVGPGQAARLVGTARTLREHLPAAAALTS